MTRIPDNRMFIICARHDAAREWAAKYGFPENSYKTITRASSLLGLARDAKLLYLDTDFDFPEAVAIQRELRKRFTNVNTISARLQPEAEAQGGENRPCVNEPGRIDPAPRPN